MESESDECASSSDQAAEGKLVSLITGFTVLPAYRGFKVAENQGFATISREYTMVALQVVS